MKIQRGTYDNEQYKIYKIVEGVSVHDIVHDIYPSFQCDDLAVETKKTERHRGRHFILMNRKVEEHSSIAMQ